MKTNHSAFLSISLLALLVTHGCNKSVTSPVDDLINLGESERSHALIVNVGDKFYLEFSEHESVGSTVNAKSLHTDIVRLANTDTTFDTPDKMKEGMTGGDSAHGVFIFEALKPGVAELVIQSKYRDEESKDEHFIIMVSENANSLKTNIIKISKSDITSAFFGVRPGSSGHLMIDLKPERLKILADEIGQFQNKETVLFIGDSGSLLVEPSTEDGKSELKHIRYYMMILNSKLEVTASIGYDEGKTSPNVYLPTGEIAKSIGSIDE